MRLAVSDSKALHRVFPENLLPLCVECNRGVASRRGYGIVGIISVAGAGAVRRCIPAREHIPGTGEAVGVQGGGVSGCDLLGSGAAAGRAIAVEVDGECAGVRTDTPHRESVALAEVSIGTQATTVTVQAILTVSVVCGS